MDKNLTLEINPNHEIVTKLNEMRKTDMKIGKKIVRLLDLFSFIYFSLFGGQIAIG